MPETVPAAGTRIGNYLLREMIGQGAFGQVWKAVHHERPGRVVAMKIAMDPAYRQQLSREGCLPDFDHPNILPILDSDTRFSEIPYLVMPFLPGGSLAELIETHPRGLPEDRVDRLSRDILAGLSTAHERGIVHRDLKPQNVLLDAAGRALISDFGLSTGVTPPDVRQSVIQSASRSVEQSRALAGTLAYMAPEVLDGAAAAPAADVYAVGLMLFEMLVGRRPAGAEVPSRRRKDLRRPEMWNLLYQRACCPLEERLADARAMATFFESLAGAYVSGLVHQHAKSVATLPLEGESAAETMTDAQRPRTARPTKLAPSVVFIPPERLLVLDLGGRVRMEVVLIPPGEFKMGSPPSEEPRDNDETQHRVRITREFYIGRHEVTQAQWRAVMGNNPSFFKGDDLPVDEVSWVSGQEFCRRLSKRTGRVVRLPTEAEWEYACRAGTTTAYHCGTALSTELANFDGLSADASSGGARRAETTPVGSFPPNAWGLHDMHGNVWEWTHDWYDRYPSARQEDPAGPKTGKFRVLRGGSWNCGPTGCRSANRCTYTPDYRNREFGLRVVVKAE